MLSSRQPVDVDRWANLLVASTLLVVLLVTLFPYEFFILEGSSTSARLFSVFGSGRTGGQKEILENILLCLPLGFALASWVRKRNLGGLAGILLALTAGCLLSLIVETLQLFLPSRIPSFKDVVANSIGALLGAMCFGLAGVKILGLISTLVESAPRVPSLKSLVLCFLGYAALAFAASVALQRTSDLSNWDDQFPLLVGN